MKFDDKYPTVSFGFCHNEDNVLKARCSIRCYICSAITYWIDIDSDHRVCSEECKEKLPNATRNNP